MNADNIEFLRAKATEYERQFRNAHAACAPENEVNLLRSMWKLWAGRLAEAESESDDTVQMTPAQIAPINMRFIAVNQTFDYFPEDDE